MPAASRRLGLVGVGVGVAAAAAAARLLRRPPLPLPMAQPLPTRARERLVPPLQQALVRLAVAALALHPHRRVALPAAQLEAQAPGRSAAGRQVCVCVRQALAAAAASLVAPAAVARIAARRQAALRGGLRGARPRLGAAGPPHAAVRCWGPSLLTSRHPGVQQIAVAGGWRAQEVRRGGSEELGARHALGSRRLPLRSIDQVQGVEEKTAGRRYAEFMASKGAVLPPQALHPPIGWLPRPLHVRITVASSACIAGGPSARPPTCSRLSVAMAEPGLLQQAQEAAKARQYERSLELFNQVRASGAGSLQAPPQAPRARNCVAGRDRGRCRAVPAPSNQVGWGRRRCRLPPPAAATLMK